MPAHSIVNLLFALLSTLASVALAVEVERTGGPFVPTPQAVVDAMLDFAKVGPRDIIVDLGSGDGRIVLTAAQRYNARGFGIEIDPELVQQSNAEAQRRGLAERASFREQDVLQARIADASVVTLYLLPGMMQSLQAKFETRNAHRFARFSVPRLESGSPGDR
jgi:SAM-dependent methyltransferase